LSGGGYLQQRDDRTPTAARISERTEIPHTAPPATSASGSPGLGCSVKIAIRPAQVSKLNMLSMTYPATTKEDVITGVVTATTAAVAAVAAKENAF